MSFIRAAWTARLHHSSVWPTLRSSLSPCIRVYGMHTRANYTTAVCGRPCGPVSLPHTTKIFDLLGRGRARACTHAHTHIHTRARAHTHTHTHTHTHKHTQDGIRLGRETAPTTEDLMDYWAFVSFKVHIYDMYVNIYMCIHTYIDR